MLNPKLQPKNLLSQVSCIFLLQVPPYSRASLIGLFVKSKMLHGDQQEIELGDVSEGVKYRIPLVEKNREDNPSISHMSPHKSCVLNQ